LLRAVRQTERTFNRPPRCMCAAAFFLFFIKRARGRVPLNVLLVTLLLSCTLLVFFSAAGPHGRPRLRRQPQRHRGRRGRQQR
jgi:hypothetical protein